MLSRSQKKLRDTRRHQQVEKAINKNVEASLTDKIQQGSRTPSFLSTSTTPYSSRPTSASPTYPNLARKIVGSKHRKEGAGDVPKESVHFPYHTPLHSLEVFRILDKMDSVSAHATLANIFNLTETSLYRPSSVIDLSRPEKLLNTSTLKNLQRAFGRRLKKTVDDDRTGLFPNGLEMEEFVQVFQARVSTQIKPVVIRHLFMKIDAMCEGRITWSDFLSYLLVEMKKIEKMKVEDHRDPYPHEPTKRCAHKERDNIIKICQMQICRDQSDQNTDAEEGKPKTIRPSKAGGSKYMTLSRNGMLRILGSHLDLAESYDLRKYFRRSIYALSATDVAYLSNVHMLAVSYDNLVIQFFKMVTRGIQLEFELRNLRSTPLCLLYIVVPKNLNLSYLLWGDSRGNINILRFSTCIGAGLFGAEGKKNLYLGHIDLQEIDIGKYPTVVYSCIPQAHDDWVEAIKHCPTVTPLTFVSCCRSSNKSVYVGEAHKLTGTLQAVKRGVLCFDYDPENQVIYAGCFDGKIRVLKARLGCLIMSVFTAHIKPITCLCVDVKRNLIVSTADDFYILVHQLSDHNHLDTLDTRNLGLGKMFPLTAMYINTHNSLLILGTKYLAKIEHSEIKDHTGNESMTSHDAPINCLAYNPLFDMVVSCDSKSTISVWDVMSGQKRIQFRSCHQKAIRGELKSMEITYVTFDPTLRRMATGGHDGCVKLWNMNNGSLLRELITNIKSDTDDVLGLIWAEQKDRIVVSLNNTRAVQSYLDETGSVLPYVWSATHEADINCMISLPPNMCASASTDGDIVIWSVMSGQPVVMFNVALGTGNVLNQKTRRNADKRVAASTNLSVTTNTNTHKMEQLDSMLPIPVLPYKKYQSMNADGDMATAGIERADFYQYDDPKYEQMAIASLMGIDPETYLFHQPSRKLLFGKDSYIQRQLDGVSTTQLPIAEDLLMNHSVECMLLLHHRINTKYTATLISGGADGWIRAWSTAVTPGLLGQFIASHNKEETIICLCTDIKNEYLITGDSQGYIKVWDIMTYCLDEEQTSHIVNNEDYLENKMMKYSTFVFLSTDMQRNKRITSRRLRLRSLMANYGLPPPNSKPYATFRAPVLLNSFRAHLGGITGLSYADHKEVIVSSSSDANLRLWTISGRYIGQFGQSVPWDLISTNKIPIVLPHDVRRVASSTTLHVWQGGVFRRWNKLKTICLASAMMSWMSSLVKAKSITNEESDDSASDDEESMTPKTQPERIDSRVFDAGKSTYYITPNTGKQSADASRKSFQLNSEALKNEILAIHLKPITPAEKKSSPRFSRRTTDVLPEISTHSAISTMERLHLDADKSNGRVLKVVTQAKRFDSLKRVVHEVIQAEEKRSEPKILKIINLTKSRADVDLITKREKNKKRWKRIVRLVINKTRTSQGRPALYVPRKSTLVTFAQPSVIQQQSKEELFKLSRVSSPTILLTSASPTVSTASPTASTASLFNKKYSILPKIQKSSDILQIVEEQSYDPNECLNDKISRLLTSKRNRFETPSITPELYQSKLESQILGRTYKGRKRHRAYPRHPPLRLYQDQCAVYHTLPFLSLEPIVAPPTPDIITTITNRENARKLQHQSDPIHSKSPQQKPTTPRKKWTRRKKGYTASDKASSTSSEDSVVRQFTPELLHKTRSSSFTTVHTSKVSTPIMDMENFIYKEESAMVNNPAEKYHDQRFPTNFGHTLFITPSGDNMETE